MHNLDLSIADISKIEGKAGCEIKVRDGKVESVKFTIAEYKRFYTQAIRGKDVIAIPPLTARICGTCSNAHLICAANAVENALGIIPTRQTLSIRKLLNYGLIIRDHALHLCVFVLPDLLGKDSILDLDENDPSQHKFLDTAFAIKAAGNNLSKATGGRSVHAPFLAVGGFTKIPQNSELKKCIQELKDIRGKVIDLIDFFVRKDNIFVMDNMSYSVVMDNEYSFIKGDCIRSSGTTVTNEKYNDYLEKVTVEHSLATGYKFDGQVSMVGALARLNLAKERLHPYTRKTLGNLLDLFPSDNIFHNNLAQAIEILHAIDSSADILNNLEIKDEKPLPFVRKESVGTGIIEAPRGTLYYRLEIDGNGKVKTGTIVVPTGRNQIMIETAIARYLEKNIGTLKDEEAVTLAVERIVRAFDPCMSCASHFLKIKWI